MRLSASFYSKDDVVSVARDLLVKFMCTRLNGQLTKAIIVETEAYAGVTDKASHAYGGRRTKRTEPIYGQGGTAYVYLCYGLHHLFNVVTNQKETPHAVLIRAGIPMSGTERMLKRRNKEKVDKGLLAGPGSLAKALGITTDHTGLNLMHGQIWIEDHGTDIADDAVTIDPRVGVDYAGEDALRPYRFRLSIVQAESLV